MSLTYGLNTAWMLLCHREGRAFKAARQDVAGSQRRVLQGILTANARCAWGQRYHFEKLSDPAAFSEAVPLSDYGQLSSSIERLARGRPGGLTVEAVTRFEPTSGSAGAQKLIPFTDSLHRQFQRGIKAWIWDLYAKRPAIRRGRAYWSISPALPRREAVGVIPIGLEDDTEYLGALQRRLAARVLAVPPTMAKVRPLAAFRYASLLSLLAARDLAFVSVWSPTFLTTLLAGLEPWQERAVHDIRHGTVSLSVAPEVRRFLPRLRADPARADELQSLFAGGGSCAEQFAGVWPKLALISCWADASAATYVPQLRELFPSIEIQPKGIVATEGIVSVPLIGHEGSVLAIRSHFFEFQAALAGGASARPRLAHELEEGGRYRIILTTGGGLYRYQLRDEVEVIGFVGGCPKVRLLGRSDRTSDLVGEKLHEEPVRAAITGVLSRLGVQADFHLLAPVVSAPPRYRLFLQLSPGAVPVSQAHIARALDEALFENPYYAYAVELGQLRPGDVRLLPTSLGPAWAVYERRCLTRGQRAGDIKPVSLDSWTGWDDEFSKWARRSAEVRVARGPPVASSGQLHGY